MMIETRRANETSVAHNERSESTIKEKDKRMYGSGRHNAPPSASAKMCSSAAALVLAASLPAAAISLQIRGSLRYQMAPDSF